MAVLHCRPKANKAKPPNKSYKNWLAGSANVQPAAPKFQASTKPMIAVAWGRWTRYDSFHSSYLISTFIAFCPSSFLGRRLTRPGLDSARKSTTSSPDSVDVCKNNLHFEFARTFLEWSC
jgi:hypothetical protein